MSFDWGSFIGGLSGAVASFCAALLAFYLQRRISRKRGTIELIHRVIRVCRSSQWTLHFNCAPKVERLRKVIVEEIITPLEDLMPLAAEVNGHLFRELDETVTSLTKRLEELLKIPKDPTFSDGGKIGIDPKEINAVRDRTKRDVLSLHQSAIEARKIPPLGARPSNFSKSAYRFPLFRILFGFFDPVFL